MNMPWHLCGLDQIHWFPVVLRMLMLPQIWNCCGKVLSWEQNIVYIMCRNFLDWKTLKRLRIHLQKHGKACDHCRTIPSSYKPVNVCNYTLLRALLSHFSVVRWYAVRQRADVWKEKIFTRKICAKPRPTSEIVTCATLLLNWETPSENDVTVYDFLLCRWLKHLDIGCTCFNHFMTS